MPGCVPALCDSLLITCPSFSLSKDSVMVFVFFTLELRVAIVTVLFCSTALCRLPSALGTRITRSGSIRPYLDIVAVHYIHSTVHVYVTFLSSTLNLFI